MHKNITTLLGIFLVLCIILGGAMVYETVYIGIIKNSSVDLGLNNNNNGNVNTGGAFTGNLQVNFQWIDHGNNDNVSPYNATAKIYHADKSTLFGTSSVGAAISGQVSPSDNGMLYLVLTPSSSAYVLATETYTHNMDILSASTPFPIAGVNSYCFPMDVSHLGQVSGITTQITINVYQYDADVSGLAFTSQLNATSADYSGTSYVASSSTGYLTGLTQKDAFKITKVQMSMPDAANVTMFDSGQIKKLSVTLGMGNGQTMTLSQYDHYTGGSYIEFAIPQVVDATQEYYGLPIVYGATDSSNAIGYSVNAEGANFAASATWVPTLTLTYISPDGTTGTISRTVSFTDT